MENETFEYQIYRGEAGNEKLATVEIEVLDVIDNGEWATGCYLNNQATVTEAEEGFPVEIEEKIELTQTEIEHAVDKYLDSLEAEQEDAEFERKVSMAEDGW